MKLDRLATPLAFSSGVLSGLVLAAAARRLARCAQHGARRVEAHLRAQLPTVSLDQLMSEQDLQLALPRLTS